MAQTPLAARDDAPAGARGRGPAAWRRWLIRVRAYFLKEVNEIRRQPLVERVDGKFQLLPYSVDLSFGQSWPREVRLGGHSSIAAGCQSDSGCWAETIAMCETLVDAFVAADPIGKLETMHEQELNESQTTRVEIHNEMKAAAGA